MSIRELPEPDIYLSAEEIAAYRTAYWEAFKFFSGHVPPFDVWVKRQIELTRREKEIGL